MTDAYVPPSTRWSFLVTAEAGRMRLAAKKLAKKLNAAAAPAIVPTSANVASRSRISMLLAKGLQKYDACKVQGGEITFGDCFIQVLKELYRLARACSTAL